MKRIPLIDSNAIFTIASLNEILGLKPGCLPRECRLRRLRYAKRAGRVYFLGSWVLEWLAAGEVVHESVSAKRNGEAK
jgi:hypothetical protein